MFVKIIAGTSRVLRCPKCGAALPADVSPVGHVCAPLPNIGTGS